MIQYNKYNKKENNKNYIIIFVNSYNNIIFIMKERTTIKMPSNAPNIDKMEYVGFFGETKNKIYRIGWKTYYLVDLNGNIISQGKSPKNFFEENGYFPLDKSNDTRYNKNTKRKLNK